MGMARLRLKAQAHAVAAHTAAEPSTASMQPLRFSINVTLDGCIDHTAGIPDEELHRRAADMIAQADALLFGRVTYQLM